MSMTSSPNITSELDMLFAQLDAAHDAWMIRQTPELDKTVQQARAELMNYLVSLKKQNIVEVIEQQPELVEQLHQFLDAHKDRAGYVEIDHMIDTIMAETKPDMPELHNQRELSRLK